MSLEKQNSPVEYKPVTTDWKALIVLRPREGEILSVERLDAIRDSLAREAPELLGVELEQDAYTDVLLFSFYLNDAPFEAQIRRGVIGVFGSIEDSGEHNMDLEAMQLAPQFNLSLYGEDVFSSDDYCATGPAYEMYNDIQEIHRAATADIATL